MNNKNSRAKYLLGNTAILTLGNIATKFITFFLVPLYTSVMSTSEFGTLDLITALVTVIGPILVLNISESIMRFPLDEDADCDKILRIGLIIYFASLVVGILIFPFASCFSAFQPYRIYIYLYTISITGSGMLLCYLRGKEKLVCYSVGNIIQIVTGAGLSFLFLKFWKWGMPGYFLASILASAITMVYAAITGKTWRAFTKAKFDKTLAVQMIKYSVVLVPNTLMWWIMNSSDRIMITSYFGAEENGIYAISYKLPTFVSVLTMIFNQAWSYSAIHEQRAADEEAFNNKVFRMFVSIVMFIGIGIITFCKPFLRIYVSENFYSAWKYIPFLTIGYVYLALGTFISTCYSVHKDSVGYMVSGCMGSILNIILNFILIPKIGVYGAAVATCTSYVVVFLFRLIHTRKYIIYDIKNTPFMVGTIIIVSSSALVYMDAIVGLVLQCVLLAIAAYFFIKDCFPVILGMLRKNRRLEENVK